MKNLSLVINGVLLIAVVILFILHFSGRKSCSQSEESVSAGMENNDGTKVVYINTDTLMNNYKLAMELNEIFMKKQEDRRTELNVKAKSLDQETNEFQRKYQNNGFLSEARAREAGEQIAIKQQNFQRLQQEMTDKMVREQGELTKKLFDTLITFLKTYNKEKGFNIVLSTTLGGNVLYAEEGFDITRDVVARLNAEYDKNNVK